MKKKEQKYSVRMENIILHSSPISKEQKQKPQQQNDVNAVPVHKDTIYLLEFRNI